MNEVLGNIQLTACVLIIVVVLIAKFFGNDVHKIVMYSGVAAFSISCEIIPVLAIVRIWL